MAESRIAYPSSRRESEVKDFHGNKVSDPYVWLEKPDASDVKEWVDAQNKVTNQFLGLGPHREQLKERMTELYDYPKFSAPFKRGNKYFFYKNNGLQNQSVLYVQDTLDGEPSVFLDPNTLSEDGTTAIGVAAFSESGSHFAYGLAKKGSDWQTIYVKPTDPKAPAIADELEWIKFSSIAWTHDDKGFFYARYPKPQSLGEDAEKQGSAGTETDKNLNQCLYYHVLGTPQSEDRLVYRNPEEPEWMFGAEVTDDGKKLLITVSKDCDPVNQLYYADLDKVDISKLNGDLPVTKLIDNFEAQYEYITNEGSIVWFKTNLDAPRYKVITIDLANPARENWKEIIAQDEKDVLSYAICVNTDKLLLVHLHDVADVMRLYSMEGKETHKFELPTVGTIASISGKKKHTDFFYGFTSFTYPVTFYHYDFTKSDPAERQKLFRAPTIKNFDSTAFETKQVFYESKDGTKIPMFLVMKKGLVQNGENPVFLYGYGGFNISIQPSFSTFRLPFLQHYNGIYAVANIRGGGEYGEEWHKAGTKGQKQNVFDDFVCAAEYLVKEKWARPERVGIYGGSNGGLLVAACVNQRPDAFGVGIAAVGVMDMLNFHRYTIGYAWTSDYGCADNKEDFDYLYKYSPVHNVRPGKQYPSLMLTTADHDDRVVPLHSYKYIAEVQSVLGNEPYQKNPLLIRIETSAGHGAGKSTAKVIEEFADVYSFLTYSMGLKWTN